MVELELQNKIIKYAESYYLGESEVSDQYFDNLVESLRKINPDNPVLESVGWGLQVTPDININLYDKGTLRKSKDIEILNNFENPIITPKLDGVSIFLNYSKGILNWACSREGKNLTNYIRKLVPIKLTERLSMTIRGEVVMRKNTFNNNYVEDYKNPRNIVSGFLFTKDLKTTDLLNLEVVQYSVHESENPELFTSKLETLSTLKLLTSLETVSVLSIKKTEFSELNIRKFINEQPWQCDGVVITENLYL